MKVTKTREVRGSSIYSTYRWSCPTCGGEAQAFQGDENLSEFVLEIGGRITILDSRREPDSKTVTVLEQDPSPCEDCCRE